MAALKNTASMMPPKGYEWLKMLINPYYDGDDIYDSDYIPRSDAMGNCLSTKQKTNGAVAIFYPGIAKEYCRKMDTEDIYLVFTSIHEVMIHNASVVVPEDLEDVLKETLDAATPEEDYLTSRIYRYCRATGSFICV